MANLIEKEAAKQEYDRILSFFEVEPNDETIDEKIVSAIGKGRIILDEKKSAIIYTLVSPIEMENGKTITELTFVEPDAKGLKILDRYKSHEKMGLSIHLVSAMTGEAIGIIDRLKARDIQVVSSIASLFF